jgi:hypothetical protein
VLEREAVDADHDDAGRAAGDGSDEPEVRQGAGGATLEPPADRGQAPDHEREREDKGDMVGDPDVACRDRSRGAVGIGRSHGMDQVADQSDDRAGDRRRAAEAVIPEVVVSRHRSLPSRGGTRSACGLTSPLMPIAWRLRSGRMLKESAW